MSAHRRSWFDFPTCRFAAAIVLIVALLAPSKAQRGGTGLLRDGPKIRAAFRQAVAVPRQSAVRIQCDGKNVALGTIVDADGYVLTKASLLKEDPKCMLNDGRSFSAAVVGKNLKYDVALLKVGTTSLKPVTWRKSKGVEPGDWVASPGLGQDPVTIGVVSVKQRKLPPAHGFMGVELSPEENGRQIKTVNPGSGAAKANVKSNDVIVKIKGKEVNNQGDLRAIMSKTLPGETISLTVRRGEDEIELKIRLGDRPPNIQNKMGSALSERATGFPFILQHDSVIKPHDCGGPLVDLDGRAVGINVARAGRTESYAIPSDYVLPLIAQLKEKKSPTSKRNGSEKAQAKLELALEQESAAKAALAAAKRAADKSKAEERLAKARADVAAARAALDPAEK